MSFVCSGNGECVGLDSCVCIENYGGSYCGVEKCNGILSSSDDVCSGNGDCRNFTCECDSGWEGDDCDVGMCYGFSKDDTSNVCSGNGECLGYNDCSCDSPYEGDECDDYPCYGTLASDISVCNGHGSCVSPDTCECFSGDYYGSTCQKFDCYDILNQLTFLVCSGQGECIDKDQCSCDTGYQGDDCWDYTCYGISQNDSDTVCGGHGQCYQPDVCICGGDYVGDECEFLECYEKYDNEYDVCSSHGECVAEDTCDCDDGWYGNECGVPICDYPNTDAYAAQICGGHGTCVSAYECSCEGNFDANTFCNNCTSDYTGTNCNTQICIPETTCSSRGVCNDLDCVCEGNFDGDYCEKCRDGFYGYETNCSVFCLEEETCNGNGTCSEYGCTCYDDEENGHFQYSEEGGNCSICSDGWIGSSCNIYISDNFTFSNEYDEVVGVIRFFPKDILTLPCSSFVHEDDVSKFGSTCYATWTSDYAQFIFSFGSNPTLMPYDTIRVNALLIEYIVTNGNEDLENSDVLWKEITILPALSPESPVAVLEAPQSNSLCDDLTLDGSDSSSSDRRGLMYHFHAIDGFNLSSINVYLVEKFQNEPNNPIMTIPNSYLNPGSSYRFSFWVENKFGERSEEINSSSIIQSTETIPRAALVQPLQNVISLSRSVFVLNGFGKICGERISSEMEEEYTFKWKQVSGPSVVPTADNNGKRLVFLKSNAESWFQYVSTYTFSFTVTSVSNTSVSHSITVVVRTKASDLVALIEGGNRTVNVGDNTLIDGSSSYDPDETSVNEYFYWSCLRVDTNSICTDELLGAGTDQRSFTHLMIKGEFAFTLRYVKGSREDSTTILITAVEEEIEAVVSISSLPAVINPNENLVVRGSVTVSGSTSFRYLLADGSMSLIWKLNGRTLKTTDVYTSLNSLIIGINGELFSAGESYTIKLLCVSTDSGKEYSSSVRVRVNSPPLAGTFSVTPTTGYAYETSFNFRFLSWTDDQIPLTYSVYYLNVDALLLQYSSSYILSGQLLSQMSILIPGTSSNLKQSRIPITGKCLITGVVKDSLGAKSTSSVIIDIDELDIQDADVLNSTLSSLIVESRQSETYEECMNPVNVAGEMMSTNSASASKDKGGGKVVTVDSSNQFNEIVGNQAIACQSVDEYFEPTVESVTENAAVVTNQISSILETETISKQNIYNIYNQVTSISDVDSSLMTEEIASSVGNALSSLLGSVDSLDIEGGMDSSELKDMVVGFMNGVSSVGMSIGSNLVVGQPPQEMVFSSFSMIASKIATTTTEVDYGSIKMGMVSDILNSGGDSLEVSTVEFENPPIETNQNLTSKTFSILFSADGNQLPPMNLSTPMPFSIGANFTESNLQTNPRKWGNRVFCAWLDRDSSTWKTDGCELVESSDSSVNCECDHTKGTDFSSIVQYAAPNMNLLTADDFANITKLNVDNMTALVFVCALCVAYLLFLIFFELYVMLFPLARKIQRKVLFEDGHLIEKWNRSLKSDNIREFIWDYVKDHMWLSLLFLPYDERFFPRPQRITVLYLLILGVFLSSALTFGQEQDNYVQMVISMIAGDIIVLPLGLISFLFQKVEGKPSLEIEKEEEDISTFKKEVIVKIKGEKRIHDETTEKNDDPEDLDDEDLSISERIIRGVLIVLFAIEQLVETFKEWMENATFFLAFSFMVIFVSIFSYLLMTIFLDIAAIFYMKWLGEFGAIIISIIAVLLFVGFFMFIFWYNKKNRYVDNLNEGIFVEWSSGVFIMANLVVCTIVEILLLIVLVVCLSLHFSEAIEHHFLIPFEIGAIAFTIMLVVWMYSVFIGPKKKKVKKRKKKESFSLPHYCAYPIYLLAFIMALVMSYLIVLYGIKFDSDPNLEDDGMPVSAKWLLGGSGSIASDFSLMEPVKHVFKVLVMYCILEMFTQVFLRF